MRPSVIAMIIVVSRHSDQSKKTKKTHPFLVDDATTSKVTIFRIISAFSLFA